MEDLVSSTRDRIAIVGGASAGLGYAVAEELLKQGKRVIIVSRSDERITAAADSLRDATGGEVAGVAVDLSEPDEPSRLLITTASWQVPPRIWTVSPAETVSAAFWMVANGAASVPAAASLPVVET